MMTNRIIAMPGSHNFRDLGGYDTKSGRQTKWGQVFRSGTMSELDDIDHQVMLGLGIEVICDLRSSKERVKQPSRLPSSAAHQIWYRDYDESGADMVALLTKEGVTTDTARQLMISLYRELAYEQAPGYRILFDRLANGPLPLLFHCAAGKDRTGIAAALLLDILEVPRETVVADYAMTDLFYDRGCKLVRAGGFDMDLIRADIWELVMRAHADYIHSMFETIEARHGSVEGFMNDVLEVDSAMIDRLRKRLLT